MRKAWGVFLILFFLCNSWVGAQPFEFAVSMREMSQIDSLPLSPFIFLIPDRGEWGCTILEKILFYSMAVLGMATLAYLIILRMGVFALLKTTSLLQRGYNGKFTGWSLDQKGQKDS